MANRNLKIPEPTLPEHALIRDCAPVPELSAGFKARVLADCSSSIVAAQRVFRLKVAAGAATLCCLSLLICLVIPSSPASSPGGSVPVVEQPTVPVQSPSVGLSPGSQGLAVDAARPVAGNNNPDKSQMNDIIEDLSDRQKIFDANMLPNF